MSRFFVYPYKTGSRSAKALALALGGRVLKRVNSKYVSRASDVVVNWGASDFLGLDYPSDDLFNAFAGNAHNKLDAFRAMSIAGVSVPNFWDESVEPSASEYFPIVCRTVLTGHSGAGIVIAEDESQLVDAPLYVQYVKKQAEYRVHVLDDNAFFIQRKARKLDVPDDEVDWKVRNLAGGFVFVVAEEAPDDVIIQAKAAIKALSLDFGAVDVIWNAHQQKAYVLEVNTACGLEERTAEAYAAAIKEAY